MLKAQVQNSVQNYSEIRDKQRRILTTPDVM